MCPLTAGHDNVPISLSCASGVLEYGKHLDAPPKREDKAATSAMLKFRTMDLKGTSDSAMLSVDIDSTHQNAINEVFFLF